MTYAQSLRRGISLAFNRKIDNNTLNEIKTAGISSVELSFGYDYYMNQIDFPRNCEKYKVMAQEAGIELWSIHLPFSGNLDISHPDDELRAITMHTNRILIEAASRAGIKVAVLHPSSEPLADRERHDRMKRSHESISLLQSQCEQLGMNIAVENLPRTCLCNRSAEMVELLNGTGAGIVFDTNHSLIEDNVSFLTTLVDSDINLHSLHISDYDFIDERHRVPGDGLNNWNGILAQLERAGYDGPLLYEVSRQPLDHDVISLDQLIENMQQLVAGLL